MYEGELILTSPSKEMKADVMQYKEEHFAYGDTQVHGSGGLAYYDDFEEWLKRVQLIEGVDQANGVRTSTFFSKRADGKLIGCIKIHHSLTSELKSGGHVAYGIRPSERGKGYGKKQLELCLEYAKQIGLEKVIIACDKDNVASAKTAMSCGGVLVKEFEEDGILKQHYEIKLNATENPGGRHAKIL